jgi:hypothetical protein
MMLLRMEARIPQAAVPNGHKQVQKYIVALKLNLK